eukprot:TRINITY_DN25737_c0_g1_i1.p1 TRINITY_DN25737_c0_g1~~TRINITY_DN25737_c0_g1_i1.p1  ORF type:complete len:1571 (+),score=461.62 TRINITY_DN25737_c0_g1_i1:80-4792(+)
MCIRDRSTQSTGRGKRVGMKVRHPGTVAAVSVHAVSITRRGAIAAVFALFYALSVHMCMDTMGDPYQAALAEIKTQGNSSFAERHANSTSIEDLMETLSEVVTEYDDEEEDPWNPSNATTGNNTETKERPRPLPSAYLPGAWACAVTFCTLTFHAFFHLLCHWLVWFKVATLYQPDTRMRVGGYVFVETHLNRGKPQLCQIQMSQESRKLVFEFQRQRYECIPAENDHEQAARMDSGTEQFTSELVGEMGNGAVTVIRPPTNELLSFYLETQGLETSRIVERHQALYGKNTLTIATPQFLALYKEQLVSPLVVFQLFTALLWMLDEYWQFVCFQIFMVLLLESTTVFQRIKTFGTLNSMSSKPYTIDVYRQNRWQQISTENLLPGDLISIKHTVPASAKKPAITDGSPAEAAPPAPKPSGAEGDSNVIPCDCLLLSGDAVVNEATLTGESIPQMKSSVIGTQQELSRELDLEQADRNHTLFSGTTLVTTREGESCDTVKTPNNGCLCCVLRTGFSSSQGTFMQMIEYSTHKLSDGSKETGYALLFLLMFALAAAGYVFTKGMEKGDRTTHELLIKCVIIITATVPKQLPMQMAMAVNTALMGLMKNGVFCTEPFRVPSAGKVSHCLFDKTGTLTTDQLVPVGIIPNKPLPKQRQPGETVMLLNLQSKSELNGLRGDVVGLTAEGRVMIELDEVALKLGHKRQVSVKTENCAVIARGLEEVVTADTAACMVLSSCQSLVDVESVGLVGDPIEMAALRGVGWSYNGSDETAVPGAWKATEATLGEMEGTLAQMKPDDPKRADVNRKIEAANRRIAESKARAKRSLVSSVRIVQRHHFESGLQRMSVVARVTAASKGDKEFDGFYSLVKGSPEAVGSLLADGRKPDWYDQTYNKMAHQGMRVLAMAYRKCDSQIKSANAECFKSREWVEKDLEFGGFIAFECRARVDSAMVIGSLKDSAHKVAMVTGDAALTALHIAKEVGISDRRLETLLLKASETGYVWVDSLEQERVVAQVDADLSQLSVTNNLLVTEADFVAAGMANPALWEQAEYVGVFARMSPSGKASIIQALQKKDHFVLMCGDGGNDVGALKQSDVGMALLSGYGNVNAGDGSNEDQAQGASGESSEELLNRKSKEIRKANTAAQKLMKEEMGQVRKDLTKKQQQWVMDELERRRNAGEDAGMMAMFSVTKETMARMQAELRQAQQDIQRKHGNIFDKDKSIEKMEEDMQTLSPVVRPGDASVAAPFTSRSPSIRNVVDLIRQGRCTLLSALQNQQIMMLECIISSYCISALSLEGGRSSERQMMASSWLIMVASIAFSYATPIDRMSDIRPLRSLFHPAVFFSMLGQAAIHLGCLIYAVSLATAQMGPEALREVVDFHKKQKMIRSGQIEAEINPEELDWTEWAMSTWNSPFLPNLLNTVIFLVETSQMIAVMFVNYKGRPWMKGIVENRPLFLSSFACIGLVVVCAWAWFPWLNEMIHLKEFPDDAFRYQVVTLVTASIFGTFVWDRLMTAVFAPEIFGAMMKEVWETRLSDVLDLLQTVGKILLCVGIYATGNPLIWFGAFMLYRNRKKTEE